MNLRKEIIERNKRCSKEYSLEVIIAKERNTCNCLYFYSFSIHKSVTCSTTSSCETTIKSERSVNPIMDTFIKSIKSDQGSTIKIKKKMNKNTKWKARAFWSENLSSHRTTHNNAYLVYPLHCKAVHLYSSLMFIHFVEWFESMNLIKHCLFMKAKRGLVLNNNWVS